jgi:hypothetical protein
MTLTLAAGLHVFFTMISEAGRCQDIAEADLVFVDHLLPKVVVYGPRKAPVA